jgi:ATP-dependent Clp protease protease subunit
MPQGRSPSNKNIKFYGEQPLIDDAVLYLTGEVNEESTMSVITALTSLTLSPRHEWPDHITLFVNSPGGNFTDGMHLIDVIMQCPIPVVTVGQGFVASMGVFILMSGVKKGRFITENTIVMSHQFSGGTYGKEHELKADGKSFDIVSEFGLRHYMKRTGKTEKYVKQHLLPPHDVYLRPEEVVKHGIVDEIVKIYV